MKHTYCRTCGRKLIKGSEVVFYSETTGEPFYRLVCPETFGFLWFKSEAHPDYTRPDVP